MRGKTALVVDDSKSARFAVRRLLEQFNYGVETVETAEEATAWLETHRPDVVFLDYTLPGADGFEVLKRIKKNARTVTIPVVICSSHEGDDFIQQARSRGAVDVMRKPPEHNQIASVLANVEHVAAAFRPAAAPPPTVPAQAKVQPIRPPAAAIEQRVMQALREVIQSPAPQTGPPREPKHATAAPEAGIAAQTPVRDTDARIAELEDKLARLEHHLTDVQQLRDIVQREIGQALSGLREELLVVVRATATQEAHAAAEHAVMAAATRVSDQITQAVIDNLGYVLPAAGARKA